MGEWRSLLKARRFLSHKLELLMAKTVHSPDATENGKATTIQMNDCQTYFDTSSLLSGPKLNSYAPFASSHSYAGLDIGSNGSRNALRGGLDDESGKPRYATVQ